MPSRRARPACVPGGARRARTARSRARAAARRTSRRRPAAAGAARRRRRRRRRRRPGSVRRPPGPRRILRGQLELHDRRAVRQLDARGALPERGERSIERVDVIATRDDRAAKRVVDLVPVVELHGAEGAQGVLQAAGADLEPSLAEDPPEGDELPHDRVADPTRAAVVRMVRHGQPASPRRRDPAGRGRGCARDPRGT